MCFVTAGTDIIISDVMLVWSNLPSLDWKLEISNLAVCLSVPVMAVDMLLAYSLFPLLGIMILKPGWATVTLHWRRGTLSGERCFRPQFAKTTNTKELYYSR